MFNKLIAFLFICINLANAEQCNIVYEEFNGHFYSRTEERLTYDEARQFAVRQGGYLVIPNSDSENNFLRRFAQGNQSYWIGIWDPSYSAAYCLEPSCFLSMDRFKTINGESLVYSNWMAGQPDNYLSGYDATRIQPPLGEHWVAMEGITGKWMDVGNHALENNNPVRFFAIFEYDTEPCRITEPTSQLPNIFCNTATNNLGLSAQTGTTYACQRDANGTSYCPASLAACQNTQNTNDGYSQEHIGMQTTHQSATCPTGTNLPSQCTGSYPNTWLKDMYTSLLNRCPDQAGYNFWIGYISANGITSSSQLQPTFCTAAARNNEPCGSTTSSPTTCYGTSLQNITVQQPVTTRSSLTCPSGGTLNGTTCNNTCTYVSSYSCPSGGTLSGTTCVTTTTSSYAATQNCTATCPSGSWYTGNNICKYVAAPINTCTGACPSGYNAENTIRDNVCGTNTLRWQTCNKYVSATTTCSGYTCPSGGTLSGTTCVTTTTSSYAATPNYSTYDCSYAATCPTGTNLPSQCTGSYPNTWLKDMYTSLLNRCPDQAGYNFWIGYISANGITSSSQLQPTFCTAAARNNEPCGSTTSSPTTCYGTSLQNVTVQQPVTTRTAATCPTGTNLPSQCTGTYPNTWLKDMYLTEFGRCPDQRGYDYWLQYISANGITSSSQLRPTFCLAASVDWQTACGTTADQSQCYGSNPYLYYTYHCNSNTNIYGESYIPQNTGGEGTTSPTPPTNNCVQQNYVCGSNPQQTCANVGGIWQCSEHPCLTGNDIEATDTPVGANDANDNGWDTETGACLGQLYIFSGSDNRCRSDDLFFGLTGGGCCDHNSVFLGLIQCQSSERMLAIKNRNNTCHYIGEYCSRRISLGFTRICVQHKKTYCCFSSKLARIINEQGRIQLDKSWGSAESPNCKGFTPDEFQSLDFSEIDLSEYTDDLVSNITNTTSSSVGNIQNTAQGMQNYYQNNH